MEELDYKQLINEGRRYLKLEFNYSKLTAVEKMSVLLSTMAVIAVVAVLSAFVVLYLASMLSNMISEATHSMWAGNLVVAVIFIAMILLVLALKKQIIIDPITRFLTKLFLTPNDNE